MKINKEDPSWVEESLRIVRDGGIVALAYERLFGLAANALASDAVARVAAIKSRDQRSSGPLPISVILPNFYEWSSVATRLSPLAMSLAKRYWPGPVTLVVPARNRLPRPLVSKTGLIGIRLAGPSPAALLALRAGVPLTATSANRAGEAEALSSEALADLAGIDLLVEGVVPGPPGSTVVDATGERPRVLRQGIVRIAEVS